jgi:MFS family permease
MTEWANNPSGAGIVTWVLLALGIVLFVVFVRHEDKTEQPMIETKLLRWRPFLAVNIYNFIFGAVVWGLVAFIPYYATVGYGMTPVQEGLLLTPRSLVIIIVSAVTSLFIERLRYRVPMIIGLLLISLSLFFLSRGYHDLTIFGVGFNNLLLLSLIVAIAGIGMGISNPAANNAALDILPEKVAAAAGMRAMFRVIGGVMGTATVTLILSYFPDKAAGMQDIYLGFAVLQLLLIPVVFLIPDAARDRNKRSIPLTREGPHGLP